MKMITKFISAMIATMWSVMAWTQETIATEEVQEVVMTMDEKISVNFDHYLGWFAGAIFSPFPFSEAVFGVGFPWIVLWLAVAAIIFTIYFGFIQLKGFAHSISLVKGDYSDPNDAGEVSHFQALATALSGTVGLGNIAGVAVAVSLGGPGATFWMILVGFFGMASKFTECTLGVKYRNEYPDGRVSGGPMYYLEKGLAEKGMPTFGKILGVVFAICCILGSFGGGNMFQSNQARIMMYDTFPGMAVMPNWVFGLVLALIVGAVVIGGIKSIAKVTEKVVPFMGVLYVVCGMFILIMNADKIGGAFGQIIDGAFSPEGVGGGIIGVLIQGMKRAAFSNEAGIGSAAIAHSAVRTKEPVTEGYVALLEPFIDTVVICTMTALVIVITGVLTTSDAAPGVELTSAAFQTLHPSMKYALAIAVVLFAFSTMISWSYYGLKAWTYLFGEGRTKELVFNFIFCCFVVVGAAISLGPVLDFSDAAIFAMSIANIIGLYFLMGVVKAELNSYRARIKSGEIKKFK